MPIPVPNLDDRDFEQLLEEAMRRARQTCPGWTDLSPSDPGRVLLELYAYLTDVMLYRLNRVPEKVYVEFLRLIGLSMQPPVAAGVKLRFSRSKNLDEPVTIPMGSRVSVARSEGSEQAPVFETMEDARVEADQSEVTVEACHSTRVEGELLGRSSGMPGQSFQLQQAPVVITPPGREDLLVGVEVKAGETVDGPVIQHQEQRFRLWEEVENFSSIGEQPRAFVAYKDSGQIMFPPAIRTRNETGDRISEMPEALGAIPEDGREIRVWYSTGGGPSGNVAAGTLTVLKDPLAGFKVTNEEDATGGRTGESMENAMVRGPHELRSLERAVTARDFELVAEKSSGAVARANAYTKAEVWPYAIPGTVDVVLVPSLPESLVQSAQITLDHLQQQQTDQTLQRVQATLDERRPLGTNCEVRWAHAKEVCVDADIVVDREQDPQLVQSEVIRRLYQTISPLSASPDVTGWPFGQSLHASHVYEIIMSQPGVRYVDGPVRLLVQNAPEEDVEAIVADPFKSGLWYASSADSLYRTTDDAAGWERAVRFADERVMKIAAHPTQPGLIAANTVKFGENEHYGIYCSFDCGETWSSMADLGFEVEDICWAPRKDVAELFLATDVGLYKVRPEDNPVQIIVNPDDARQAFYGVCATVDVLGGVHVAAAAQEGGGVFVSNQAGNPKTFENIGLKGKDVRVLATRADGSRRFLWAGLAAVGDVPGEGCYFFEITNAAADWRNAAKGWDGGSCNDLAFSGGLVLAATHHSGVLWLDSSRHDAAWKAPEIGCGLPLRSDAERPFPVQTVGGVAEGGEVVLAGGSEGVYRTRPDGELGRFENCSGRVFTDRVTLPETWLFCSGQHSIEVVRTGHEKR